MKKIEYDSRNRQYYVISDGNRRYLHCGDRIIFKDKKEDINFTLGKIDYSSFVSRGYYISLNDGKNYIPLFMIQAIDFHNFIPKEIK